MLSQTFTILVGASKSEQRTEEGRMMPRWPGLLVRLPFGCRVLLLGIVYMGPLICD